MLVTACTRPCVAGGIGQHRAAVRIGDRIFVLPGVYRSAVKAQEEAEAEVKRLMGRIIADLRRVSLHQEQTRGGAVPLLPVQHKGG